MGTRGPGGTSHRVGLLDLPKNLRLAEDHRVQPARDGEDVPRGMQPFVHVQMALENDGIEPALLGQEEPELEGDGHPVFGTRQDLDPVARGEDQGFLRRAGREQPLQRPGSASSEKQASSRRSSGALRWFMPMRESISASSRRR
jgi:hypothetical protein